MIILLLAPVPAGATGDTGIWLTGAARDAALGLYYNDGLKVSVNANGIAMEDARDIATGTTTGTVLARTSAQKLALWGATPVVQQAHTVDADGSLADITTKFNALLAKLEAIGLLASS